MFITTAEEAMTYETTCMFDTSKKTENIIRILSIYTNYPHLFPLSPKIDESQFSADCEILIC